MVRREKTKISVLVYVTVATFLFILPLPADMIGLYADAPWWHRLTYHFFHASLLHMLLNCWVLLCIVFLYDISAPMLIGALLVASSYPFAAAVPTIGVSGVIYALLGRYSFCVAKPLKYHLWFAFFIGIGFFFTNCNAWLHLYCYGVGTVISLLNKPIVR